MKRLSDERVQEIQENEGAGRIDNPDYQGGEDLDSLFRDHLQAREDRTWLVKQLRRMMCENPSCGHCVDDRKRLDEMDPQ